MVKNLPMQETSEMSVRSLSREDPLKEGMTLQYSCVENPMNRGAWQAAVHGVSKSETLLKQLSTYGHP